MKKIIIYLLLFSTSMAYSQKRFESTFVKYGVEGSTTIYHQNKRKWVYSDSLDAQKQTSPFATFNIINACIALETGAIKTENDVLKNDAGQQADLKTAFKNNNDWYFTALAKKIGAKDYLEFLKACNYGNNNFSSGNPDFWNSGKFGISPVGQINFLRVLNAEQLPFSPRTFRIAKELMGIEKVSDYLLKEKIGVASLNGKDVCWYIGGIQRGDHVYYFATRVTKQGNKTTQAFADAAKKVTFDILKQLKAFD